MGDGLIRQRPRWRAIVSSARGLAGKLGDPSRFGAWKVTALFVLWAAATWFFVAVMVAHIAVSKGYGLGAWVVLGVLFGVFALPVIGFREHKEQGS